MGLTKITSDGITDGTIATADLADQSVSLAKLPHGTSSNDGKFLRANNGADPSFESVITDLVDDTSPQLGGTLDSNGHDISINSGLLEIRHTSCHIDFMESSTTNHRLRNGSGNFHIQNISDDKSTTTTNFLVDGGTGAVELYKNGSKKLETTSSGISVTGAVTSSSHIISGGMVDISDNNQLRLGDDQDMMISHDGTSGAIRNATGELYLRSDGIRLVNNGNSETFLTAANNGAVELYHNNSKKLETDNSGVSITGRLDTTTGIRINADNQQLKIGSGDDLQLYHDGNDSFIDDAGTGSLLLRTTNNSTVAIKNSRANMARFLAADAVELYHNNVKQFQTTENGIHVPKGVIRGDGGTKVIIGGTINPSQDKTWNFSFSTNAHGYNEGYVFAIKFYMNHWNHGNYWKYVEALRGGRGNVTGINGHTQVNELGATASNWNNGHIDFEVTLGGGTITGSSASLFKVKYDADGAPAWTSGYYLEVVHSAQIGTVSIT